MKKRHRDQIIASILETCDYQGAPKTKVVYTTNMNFNTINPYLAAMAEDGLLEVINGSPVLYKTTKKGFEALEHLRAFQALIPGFKLGSI
jgi:predicted transcriptional regulator